MSAAILYLVTTSFQGQGLAVRRTAQYTAAFRGCYGRGSDEGGLVAQLDEQPFIPLERPQSSTYPRWLARAIYRPLRCPARQPCPRPRGWPISCRSEARPREVGSRPFTRQKRKVVASHQRVPTQTISHDQQGFGPYVGQGHLVILPLAAGVRHVERYLRVTVWVPGCGCGEHAGRKGGAEQGGEAESVWRLDNGAICIVWLCEI